MGLLASRLSRIYGMPYSSAQRLLRDVSLLLGLGLLAMAFVKYATLPSHPYRERVIHIFNAHFLPVVVVHVLIFVVLILAFKIRPRTAVLFWLGTAIWLVALGGAVRSFAFLLVVVYAAFLLLIGMAVAERIVEPDSRSLGLYLALGIGVVASLVPYLASFHILRFWVLLSLFVGIASLSFLTMKRQLGQRLSSAWTEVNNHWTATLAVAIEIAVVLAGYLLVASTPPETTADAIRFYWPYIKWMERLGGFVNLPHQWSYVIPQAGVGFSSTLFILFGERAVRWSMLLPWVAMVGIGAKMLRPRPDRETTIPAPGSQGTLRGVGLGIAVLVAACPLLLFTTSSLMTDCFVCMVTVLMAVFFMGGRQPESIVFWLIAGALVGLNWSAKFTAIAYAAPLFVMALVRVLRTASIRRWPLYFGAPAVGFLLAAGPWLWNSYKLSGNPVFPLLLNVFPSEVWPYRSGIGNLSYFQMSQVWWQKLLIPLEMTYNTSRYVEGGSNGVLGLVLILFLILAVPALRRSSWKSWSLFASGMIGTLALWQMTTYLRYWLPGLWLVALGLGPGAADWIRGRGARFVFVLVAGTIAVYQILFAMAIMWSEPDGWPWKYYRGGLTDKEYLDRGFPGFAGLRKVPELNEGWPKIWFTTAGIVGQLPVLPLEAAVWELNLHVKPGWRARVQYLGSLGCRYWVVNEDTGDEVWIRGTGLGRFFWDEESRIAKTGPYGVFRMKSGDEIIRALDSNNSPGSELLADGGFESLRKGKPVFWIGFQEPILQPDAAGAKEGSNYVVVTNGDCWAQVTPIPRGVKKVELSQWMKRANTDQPSAGQLLLQWVNADGQVIEVKKQTCGLGAEWTECRLQIGVPEEAEEASVFAIASEGTGPVYVDDSHLRVLE